jgi:hypothetical protein
VRVQLDPDNPDLWAEVKDVKEVLSGDVKAARRVVRVTIDDGTRTRTYDPSQEDAVADVMLTRCVTSWTLPLPLPAEDPAVLDRLTLDVYARLKEAVDEHAMLLWVGPRPSSTTSSGSSTG